MRMARYNTQAAADCLFAACTAVNSTLSWQQWPNQLTAWRCTCSLWISRNLISQARLPGYQKMSWTSTLTGKLTPKTSCSWTNLVRICIAAALSAFSPQVPADRGYSCSCKFSAQCCNHCNLKMRCDSAQCAGEGEFGIVHMAKWHGTLVAAKIIKDSSAIALGDFRSELDVLRRVHHPNAVQFLGACTKQTPYILVSGQFSSAADFSPSHKTPSLFAS